MVNRLWKIAFGQGLVRNMDDFGTQGAPPTHPELLDWLATEFIRSKWDVKSMLKLIVSSNTYKQSSVSSKALRDKDPSNLWLARQNRFRLDAEFVRDNTLAISGLLCGLRERSLAVWRDQPPPFMIRHRGRPA
jgi:hypothetical protein